MKQVSIYLLLFLIIGCKKSTNTAVTPSSLYTFHITVTNNPAFDYTISEYQPNSPDGITVIKSGTNVTSLDYSFIAPYRNVVTISYPFSKPIVGSNLNVTYMGIPMQIKNIAVSNTTASIIYNLNP